MIVIATSAGYGLVFRDNEDKARFVRLIQGLDPEQRVLMIYEPEPFVHVAPAIVAMTKAAAIFYPPPKDPPPPLDLKPTPPARGRG